MLGGNIFRPITPLSCLLRPGPPDSSGRLDGGGHRPQIGGRQSELLHHLLRDLRGVVVAQMEVELDISQFALHLGADHQAKHVRRRPGAVSPTRTCTVGAGLGAEAAEGRCCCWVGPLPGLPPPYLV